MKKIWEKNYTYHKKKFKLKFFETENSTKLGLYNLDDSELLIKTFANGKENYITYTSIITNSDKFQIENDREDIEKIFSDIISSLLLSVKFQIRRNNIINL